MPDGGKFVFMSSGASVIDRVPDKMDTGYGITKVHSASRTVQNTR